MVPIRDPDAAHQLGLADIQRRDPLDDLSLSCVVVSTPGLLA
jgi:hypothetical protein